VKYSNAWHSSAENSVSWAFRLELSVMFKEKSLWKY